MLAFAEEEEENKVGMTHDSEEKTNDWVSPVTELIAFVGIGVFVGLVIPPFKNKYTYADIIRKGILPSVGALSIAAGAVHLLLVSEHGEESYYWGVCFLLMGVAQILFAGSMMFVHKLPLLLRRILCYIGIAGNALLVVIFVYARLFTPPFSPEGTPVNELELNGIITALIIQPIIVLLLVYAVKGISSSKKAKTVLTIPNM